MLARDPIIMNQQIPISPVETRTTKSLDDRQEHIRRRAFEIYEQRGRQDGLDLEDWLQAESEVVTASHSRAVRSAEMYEDDVNLRELISNRLYPS